MSPAQRRVADCLPGKADLPYPLVDARYLARTEGGRVSLKYSVRGPASRHALSITVLEFRSPGEAQATLRDRSTFSRRDSLVLSPGSRGVGDECYELNPGLRTERKAMDPHADESATVHFTRARYHVVMSYRHMPPSEQVPTGKTWMNGDPVKEVWRLARLVDSRLKALDAPAPAPKRARKKKGG